MANCPSIWFPNSETVVNNAHEVLFPMGQETFAQAQQFAVDLSKFSFTPVDVNVTFGDISPPAGPRRPDRPDFPEAQLGFNAPTAPGVSPSYSRNTQPLIPSDPFVEAKPEINYGERPGPMSTPAPVMDYGERPQWDVGVAPVIDSGDAPQPLVLGDLPDFDPGVELPTPNYGSPHDPNYDDMPSALEAVNPGTAPTLPSRVIPEAPGITRPPAPDLEMLSIPGPPQIEDIPFVGTVPGDADYPELELDWDFEPKEYLSALLDKIKGRVSWGLDGGIGLPEAIQDALWARARGRVDMEEARAVQQTIDEFATRGFTEPNGILNQRIEIARQNNQNQRLVHNRELLIEEAKLEIENLRFMVQQGVALEGTLIHLHTQEQALNMQAAQFLRDTAIRVFEAKASLVRLKYDVFAVQAQVYKTRLEAEISKIDVFKAQIDAEKARGEINEQRVRAYEAQMRAVTADVELYNSQIRAFQGQLQADGLVLETFRTRVQAFAEQVSAKSSEWNAYATRINAEVAKLGAFNARVGAYTAEIGGYRAAIDAKSAKVAAAASNNQAKAQASAAEWEGYRARIGAETAKVGAFSEVVRAKSAEFGAYGAIASAEASRVGAYSAEVQAKSAEWSAYGTQISAEASKANVYESLVRAFAARVGANSEQNRILLERERMDIQQYEAELRSYGATLEKIKTELATEQARVQSVSAAFAAQAQVFSADANVEQAISSAHDRRYGLDIQKSAAAAQVAAQNGQMQIQQNMQFTTLQAQVQQAATQVLSQLAASALSAVNYSASISNGGSTSVSCSTNHSYAY